MKEWHDKHELLDALVKARAEARDTVPRSGGNDALEAGMFIAQLYAAETLFEKWRAEQEAANAQAADQAPSADTPPDESPAPDAGETEAPADEAASGTMTEAEPEDDHPHRGRRKKS